MIANKGVKTLHISAGYTCNNACLFCMESDKESRYRIVKNFIATKHMYHEIDKHKNVKKVAFSRGEPTLNPNLAEYVAYAKNSCY